MSSKGEEEIDIDDPDFWQKWAKKAELDVDLMNKVGFSTKVGLITGCPKNMTVPFFPSASRQVF